MYTQTNTEGVKVVYTNPPSRKLSKEGRKVVLPNVIGVGVIRLIQLVVAEHAGISVELLKSRTRKREVVMWRQISAFFSRQFTRNAVSYYNIGLLHGGYDHATMKHAESTVVKDIGTNKAFRQEVMDIERKIHEALGENEELQ